MRIAAFDESKIKAFLNQQIPELEINSLIKQSEKDDNFVVLINDELIARFIKIPKSKFEKEVQLLKILDKNSNLLIPKLYYSNPSFYIVEKLNGIQPDKDLINKLSQEEFNLFAQDIAKFLYNLHSTNLDELRDITSLNVQDYSEYERELNELLQAKKVSDSKIIDFINETLVEFQTVKANLNRKVLLHNDFKVQNILFDESQKRFSGVYDFELAQIGDPHNDFKLLYKFHHLPLLERVVEEYGKLSGNKINLRAVVLIARIQHLINLYLKHYGEDSEVFIKAQEKLNKYMDEKDLYK
jgi:aminoglycoside phosphotransferase (APT) family kinase protein